MEGCGPCEGAVQEIEFDGEVTEGDFVAETGVKRPLLDGNSEHSVERPQSGLEGRNVMDGGGHDRVVNGRLGWKTGRRRRWTWGCKTRRKRHSQSLGRGVEAMLVKDAAR